MCVCACLKDKIRLKDKNKNFVLLILSHRSDISLSLNEKTEPLPQFTQSFMIN